MIPVTKSFLPPLDSYTEYLKKSWNKKWLTNRGELVVELENKLKDYLGVNHLLCTNNGTIPIQIALKLFAKGGEVITTPFSYVATSASIVWENCKPIFVDISPEYLTIDENKIENAITNKTTCILATHVFGNPCDVIKIEEIANKHNLKVIYDAAHAFNVNYNNKSLFTYGDISTCSFHATKLFHTGEGGGIFCNDPSIQKKVFYSHNFGHNGPLDFHGLGINGKMSELQAALGLSLLPYMKEIINNRVKIVNHYNSGLDFSSLRKILIRQNTNWNYSYYPVIFESEKQLLDVENKLNALEIYPRRYFYPSLNTISYMKQSNMNISEDISSRILCLPLFHDLKKFETELIIKTINDTI